MSYENPGQPPFYTDPDELAKSIDEYFAFDVRKKIVFVGRAENRQAVEVEIPTMAGLAHYLGFASRQSLYDYEKNPRFSYVVKRARLFIETHYEEMLQQGNTVGAIFALKNMGWRDEKFLDHSTQGKPITSDMAALTDEELQTMARLHRKAAVKSDKSDD